MTTINSGYNRLPNQRALPILSLDFDGVIHDYLEGWRDGTIYGKPTEGFWEWAAEAKKYFKLVIFSSRSAESHKGIKPMQDWLTVNLWDFKQDNPMVDITMKDFNFVMHKPKAFITIDDRAIQFGGNWKWEELEPAKLKNFKPWNMKGKKDE